MDNDASVFATNDNDTSSLSDDMISEEGFHDTSLDNMDNQINVSYEKNAVDDSNFNVDTYNTNNGNDINDANNTNDTDDADIFSLLCSTLNNEKSRLDGIIINALCIVEENKGKIVPVISLSSDINDTEQRYFIFDGKNLAQYDLNKVTKDNTKELY